MAGLLQSGHLLRPCVLAGIGLGIAKQLLDKGYKVVLVSRNLERLETAIESISDHANEAGTAWALPLAKDVSTVSSSSTRYPQ